MAVGNCVFVLCENEIYQIYLVSRSMDSWKLVIATNSTTAAVELNPCSCLLPVGENITALEVLVAHSYMTSSSQADEVAHAVRACDDVLVYLIPSEKAFYCQQLRPRMVSIMSYLDCSRSGCSVQAESVSSFPVSFT